MSTSQNDHRITEEDLILLACDELDQQRREELEACLASDPETARQVHDLSAALCTLTQGSAPDISADFNASLRRRLLVEFAEGPASGAAGGPARRRWSLMSLPLVAAAAIILVVLTVLPSGPRSLPGGVGVAWADVVKAVAQAKQFHVTAFADEPRNANSPKMYRIDLYYQAPDRFRAQGLGHVQFTAAGQTRLYNIEDGKFIDSEKSRLRPIPRGLSGNVQNQSLLQAILTQVFENNVPEGEPVKSDQAMAGQGLEVFDYARSASEQWARIWVLKESRLPVRLKVFRPQSDDFLLVEFDYSDPQPDGFFDATAFEQEVKKTGVRGEHQVYGIGTEPISGTKPRGSGQIYAAQGGYKAPTIKSILANELGDMLVITDRIRNTPPAGVKVLSESFDRVRDNWGNTYWCAGILGTADESRWYFMPAPTYREPGGPRKLTLDYSIQTAQSGVGFKTLVMTQSADVPAPTIVGVPAEWGYLSDENKLNILRAHIGETGTLVQQLQLVRQGLAHDPKSAPDLIWMFRLLRDYDREDAAWTMFEKQLRDRLLGDPTLLCSAYPYYIAMGQYLVRLASTGQNQHLDLMIGRLEKIKDQAMASSNPRTRQTGESAFDSYWSLLGRGMLLPQMMKAAVEDPKVLRTIASKDGYVFCELQIPPTPAGWQSTGGGSGGPSDWFWWPMVQGRGPDATAPDFKSNRLALAIRSPGGTLTLSGEVTVLADNYGTSAYRNVVRRKWSIKFDAPSPTIDNMSQWWDQEMKGRVGAQWFIRPGDPAAPATAPTTRPVPLMQAQAEQALKDKQYEMAADLYQKIAAAPDDAWPDYYRHPANDAGMIGRDRWAARATVIECLAGVGKIEEAAKEAEAMRAQLPSQPRLDDLDDIEARAVVRGAEIQIVWKLYEQKQLDRAMAMMDQIAKDRPDLTTMLDRDIVTRRGAGMSHWTMRGKQKDVWRRFDSVLWSLLDAREAAGR